MPEAAARPFIFVLAGVNGAGKSSVGGAMLTEHGLTWFNPDTYARELISQLGLEQGQANGLAWEHGRSRLEVAIADRTNYAFETTLGAMTIPELLAKASRSHDVVMLFVVSCRQSNISGRCDFALPKAVTTSRKTRFASAGSRHART